MSAKEQYCFILHTSYKTYTSANTKSRIAHHIDEVINECVDCRWQKRTPQFTEGTSLTHCSASQNDHVCVCVRLYHLPV